MLVAADDDDRRFIAVADHGRAAFARRRRCGRCLRRERRRCRHRVDRKSRVSVRGCLYSVPARYVGRRCRCVSATAVEVLDGARRDPARARSRKGDEVLVLDHYLEVLAIKPGAFPGATALARARAAGTFTAAHERFWTPLAAVSVTRRHPRPDRGAAVAPQPPSRRPRPPAMTAALDVGSLDAEVVAVEARRHGERTVAPVIPIGALARYDRPAPALDTTTSC